MYLMKISFGSLVEHAKLSLKKMKKFDYVLLLSAFLLLAIGITAVYSATYTRTTSFYQKQILWAIIGTGMFFTFSNIDYRIYSRYSKLIYIFNVVFLIFNGWHFLWTNGESILVLLSNALFSTMF